MRLHEALALTWRDIEVITKKGVGRKLENLLQGME